MAWQTRVESDLLTLDQNFESPISASNAIVISLNPREIANLWFTVRHDGAGTDDVEIQILSLDQVSTGNTLDGVTADNDVELDTAADGFGSDDELNGYLLAMTSGNAQGEARFIIDSVAADDGVILSHAFTAGIAGGDSYDLYRVGVISNLTIDLADPSEDDRNSREFSLMGKQRVMVLARMDGATNTPDFRLSYETDGVSAT